MKITELLLVGGLAYLLLGNKSASGTDFAGGGGSWGSSITPSPLPSPSPAAPSVPSTPSVEITKAASSGGSTKSSSSIKTVVSQILTAPTKIVGSSVTTPIVKQVQLPSAIAYPTSMNKQPVTSPFGKSFIK